MISLTKSKEYARLAANIPAVLTLQKGKKVLNDDQLQKIGILHGGKTPQDAYLRSLRNLRVH